MQALVGLLLASLITVSAATLYMPKILQLERERHDYATSTQFANFANAAQNYLVREREDLVQQVMRAGGPVSFDATALVTAGVLHDSFQDSNTFGQQHALVVAANSVDARHVDGLALTVGGEEMNWEEVARIAQNSGVQAGYIHADRPAQIWGSSGLWSTPVANFVGGRVPAGHQPEGGHLMALLTSSTVPVDDLQPRLHGVVVSGDTVAKPPCGALAPRIFVVPVRFSDNGGGFPVLGVQAFAEDSSATEWTARLQMFREHPRQAGAAQRLEIDAVHGRIAVFTGCG